MLTALLIGPKIVLSFSGRKSTGIVLCLSSNIAIGSATTFRRCVKYIIFILYSTSIRFLASSFCSGVGPVVSRTSCMERFMAEVA